MEYGTVCGTAARQARCHFLALTLCVSRKPISVELGGRCFGIVVGRSMRQWDIDIFHYSEIRCLHAFEEDGVCLVSSLEADQDE